MDIDEELIDRLGADSCLALSPEERTRMVSDLAEMVGVMERLAGFGGDGTAEGIDVPHGGA
ncbi:MAG: hypothetical protein FWD94_05425 [Treponema sp.]|nr:hypothetical protein [Treponema sp.]